MEYLLFTIALLLIAWGYPRIGFIKRSGLSRKEILLLLLFKIATGLVVAAYFSRISTNDYTVINEEGILQYQLLMKQPLLFFNDFTSDIERYGMGGLFETKDSFWAYVRFTALYKCMAILNLVTRGNFYLNTALFSSLVFLGHIAFFRIYHSIYNTHKWKIIFACFCLPSLFTYTACIHKDGVIFLCLGMISYIFYRCISEPNNLNWKSLLMLTINFLLISLFRNYVLVALIPAMIIAILSRRLTWNRWAIFAGSYLVFMCLFFATRISDSPLNLPAAVVQRKADFALLEPGNTAVAMNELQPDLQSFAQNLPHAINHYLFRPYLWEFKQPAILFTAVELFVYHLLILLFIFFPKKKDGPIHPYNIFGLALLLNMMLIIGYTIPNIGAIVRYRSIFWVFLICPLLCNINWKRLLKQRIVDGS